MRLSRKTTIPQKIIVLVTGGTCIRMTRPQLIETETYRNPNVQDYYRNIMVYSMPMCHAIFPPYSSSFCIILLTNKQTRMKT